MRSAVIPAVVSRLVRFGAFEVDLLAGELRKSGIKIKLQEKPFQVLALLLEHGGDVVTREELREKLWPADTFVDFDHSMGTAVAKLRQALGDSAQNPRFVETVSSRGYRFIMPVSRPSERNEPAALAVPFSEQNRTQTQPSRLVRQLAGSVTAGLLGGALLLGILLSFDVGGARQWLRRHSNHPVRSLAVLPLQNLSGDPAQEYFADGMTDALITNLAQFGDVQVISRTSVMSYKGTTKPLSQIGRELNVDAVVEGSVMRSGKRARITAQLVDARTDQHLWAQRFDRDSNDVLVVQSEIARAIADEIEVKLTPAQQNILDRAPHIDPELQEAYLQGRYHLNKGDEAEIRKAIEYFQQALRKSPQDARSYAGLADSYMALDDFYEAPEKTMPRAKEAAQKAVNLDASLAEAHTSLGAVHFLYDWDWTAAEKEIKQSIQLNPGSADAHMWYAEFLAQMGRSPEAISEIKQAEGLDPLSLPVHVQAGWVYYLARDDEKAMAEWRKSLDLEPHFAVCHTSIWAAYLQKSEFRKIVTDWPKEGPSIDSTLDLAALAGSYAAAGKRSEAEHTLAKLRAISKTRYVCPYEMGTAHAMLGNKDEAIGWLQKGYRVHSSCMPDMKTDPRLDSLRADPRFQDLLRSLRFPQ
jgi:TolB-like protein/DNA-binding winged helix-turn-helix (wHTH) protein/Tfp pilus assembly protein PilF